MKKITPLVIIFMMLFILYNTLNACTVIIASHDEIVLGGTNKDWNNIETRILFIPSSEDKYGRVYFGYQVSEGFQNVGGMNDQGLWYDGASLPERYDIENYFNKPTVEGELCEKALEECATVEEVIDMYSTYYTPHWSGHSMWADQNGNSVIIEFGETDVVFVQKQEIYQVMTNFYVSDSTNIRWYNCYRYKVAENMFENTNEISVNLFRSILDATHQVGTDPTVFSNIYDLKNGEIFVYNFHNYSEVVKLNLEEELSKGENYYHLPSLFHQVKLRSPINNAIEYSESVTFLWNGNAESYYLYYSQDPNFVDCEPHRMGESFLPDKIAYILSSLSISFILIGSVWMRRKKHDTLLILLIFALTFMSCSMDIITSPYPPSKIKHSVIVNDLQKNSLYYWKVVAIGDSGINSESEVQTFSTGDF